MNILEKILYFLQGKMNTPISYGWFHLLWIVLTIIMIVFLYILKDNSSKKNCQLVLGIYGITALILELLKQLIWSFNYDPITNIVTWNYQWYAFPFQLCTTPIFVSILCLFLREGKFKKSLLSYMAFVTILGSIATLLIPSSCFTSDILVNIHTMWLHCGSLVVSIYLLISGIIELKLENLKNAIYVFLAFIGIALALNFILYNSGILHGEVFNMFYISPYFISTLPVFDVIQKLVPYWLYLLIYFSVLTIGALIVYFVSLLIKSILNKKKLRL